MDDETRVEINQVDDAELVEMAANSTIGTASGMSAQKAQAELMRRNTEALVRSSKSSDRYALNALVLTVMLFSIAASEFLLGIIPVENTWLKGILGLILLVGFIYVVVKEFQKD